MNTEAKQRLAAGNISRDSRETLVALYDRHIAAD